MATEQEKKPKAKKKAKSWIRPRHKVIVMKYYLQFLLHCFIKFRLLIFMGGR